MPCVSQADALFAQRLELLLQLAQLTDTGGDMPDVLVEQRVDLTALGLRLVFEPQQHADLVQRHVQRPAMPHEGQPLDVLGPVDAVVAFAARCLRQQALAFVVADGLDLGLCCQGQFTDLDGRVPLQLAALGCRAMTAMPARQMAPPTRSHRVGTTPSTRHSQSSATTT